MARRGAEERPGLASGESAAARLYLASTSPRRSDLLTARGLSFETVAPHADETLDEGCDPVAAARDLARRKAMSVAERVPRGFVIGADTIVWTDGRIFGKPANRDDARRVLAFLSGRTHQVTTGFAVLHAPSLRSVSAHRTARVTMRPLTAAEIDAYVASGEADDKAGSYGIQGAAAAFVTAVEGGRDVVIGLPVDAVLESLASLGFPLPGEVPP